MGLIEFLLGIGLLVFVISSTIGVILTLVMVVIVVVQTLRIR